MKQGLLLLLMVSVYKVVFKFGECICWVSFRGYKEYTPYFNFIFLNPKPL